MTHRLLTDVFSSGKGSVQYGKAGDLVKIAGEDHGHVFIVENYRGEKFPVNAKKVEEIKMLSKTNK